MPPSQNKLLYFLTLILTFSLTVNFRITNSTEGLPSLTIVEFLSYGMLALLLMEFAANRNFSVLFNRQYLRANLPVVLYFIWSGSAALAGILRSTESLRLYKNLFPSIILFIFISMFITSNDRLKKLFAVYLLGITLNGVLGLIQVQTDSMYLVGIHDATNYKLDLEGNAASNLAMGLYPHPNGLAMFLIPGFLLAWTIALRRPWKGIAPIAATVSLLALLSYDLVFTYAKGAYAWISIGIALTLLPRFLGQWKLLISVIVFLIGTMGLTAYTLDALSSDHTNLGTLVTRYQLWQAGLHVIQNDIFVMVFGNGYTEMFHQSRIFSNIEYANSHNALLNQVLAFGLPALVFYLWAIATAMARVSKSSNEESRIEGMCKIFLFAAIPAYVGISFLEPSNDDVVLQAQLFLLLALSYAVPNMKDQTEGHASETRRCF